MFFFQIILVLIIVYSFSCVVGELLISSKIKSQMNSFVSVCLGFIFITMWHTIFFKFISIISSWMLGISCLLLFGYFYRKNKILFIKIHKVKYKLREHTKNFIFLLIFANIFFAPLHISGNYGPFTDGGGDISIYADMAKYLNDKSIPSYGIKDSFDHVVSAFNSPRGDTDNIHPERIDINLLNPPRAEYAVYRTITLQAFGVAINVLIAQWDITNLTTYAVFFAILAFLFSSTIILFFLLLIEFGKLPAFIGTFMLICSVGFVAIFYNMYLMQCHAAFLTCLSIYLFKNLSFREVSPNIFIITIITFILSGYFLALMLILPFYFLILLANSRSNGLDNEI